MKNIGRYNFMKDYTVKEIADLISVSKTTIQKFIKNNGIEYDYIKSNRQYYSFSKVKMIIVGLRGDFEFTEIENSPTKTENQIENSPTKTEKPKIETENFENEIENSKTKTENSPTEMETLNRMLDMLQAEVEKKDKTIQDLQNKLDNAYSQIADFATKAQYITAADKTVQIMDKQQQMETEVNAAAANEVEQPPKKSLWKRLFNK